MDDLIRIFETEIGRLWDCDRQTFREAFVDAVKEVLKKIKDQELAERIANAS